MSFDQKSFDVFKEHVLQFDNDFTKKHRKPHSKDYRSIRIAIRDQVIGLLTLKHQTKENVVEVDVFLTEDPEWINGYGGTKMATLFILSTAYKCGSTMGIKFTDKVEDGTIPTNLIEMAESFGIELKYIMEGFITPKESRMLYLALTGFSSEALRRIKELSIANIITPERICYMIHHGIWSLAEMESIILGCENPELILGGTVDICDYLTYFNALSTARSAILGGFIDRKLRLKEVVDDGQVIDLEANDRKFKTFFDPRFFAKVYDTLEDTPIPWIRDQDWIVPAGQRLVIAVRPYDWTDLHNNLERDLEMCRELIKCYPENEFPIHFFMFTPRDVFSFPENLEFETYRLAFEKRGFTFMVCPELMVKLDDDVQKRLQKVVMMRHDIPTGEAAKRDVVISKAQSLYNSPELTFVSVDPDIKEGVIDLSHLTTQSLYDEVELANKVNRTNVEKRYHRVMDRIAYVGKSALVNQTAPSVTFPNSFLEELVSLNLTKMIYPNHLLEGIISQIKSCHFSQENQLSFSKLISFLEKSQVNQQTVILFLDKFAKNIDVIVRESVDDDELESHFKGQYVLDKVIDYSDKKDYQVAEQLIWNGVNRAKYGQLNAVNIGELSNPIITQVLNSFLYRELKDDSKIVSVDKVFPVSINILYTDGSKAKPFPLCRLKKRSSQEMVQIRKQTPLKIGMMSCRHSEMDREIDRYWIRNIEVKMAGRSTAEKDEFVYQTTKAKLAQILEQNKPIRIEFYQTGFSPVVIGFYRALSEFLIETQSGAPYIEVIPYFYNGKNNYEKGTSWC